MAEEHAALVRSKMGDAPYCVDVATKGDRIGEELSLEERTDRAVVLLNHNPGFRSVFRRVLAQCEGRAVPLGELEVFVAALPGYEKLKTPPFFPLYWLHGACALEELYLDAGGTLLSSEDVRGLSEDEFDDLVVELAYRTTEAGAEASRRFSPSERLTRLFQEEDDRRATYLEVLRFLDEKRSFAQIEALLRGRDVLAATSRDGVKIQPSLFVDKLEAAGAIAFDGGWQTTSEGREVLAALD